MDGLIERAMAEREAVVNGQSAVPQKDGSVSTEKTITIEADGKHYVIPTIINGKSFTPEAAANLFMARKIQPLGAFESAPEAQAFAEQRSRDLDKAHGGEGVLMKGPSDPAQGGLFGQEQFNAGFNKVMGKGTLGNINGAMPPRGSGAVQPVNTHIIGGARG